MRGLASYPPNRRLMNLTRTALMMFLKLGKGPRRRRYGNSVRGPRHTKVPWLREKPKRKAAAGSSEVQASSFQSGMI